MVNVFRGGYCVNFFKFSIELFNILYSTPGGSDKRSVRELAASLNKHTSEVEFKKKIEHSEFWLIN